MLHVPIVISRFWSYYSNKMSYNNEYLYTLSFLSSNNHSSLKIWEMATQQYIYFLQVWFSTLSDFRFFLTWTWLSSCLSSLMLDMKWLLTIKSSILSFWTSRSPLSLLAIFCREFDNLIDFHQLKTSSCVLLYFISVDVELRIYERGVWCDVTDTFEGTKALRQWIFFTKL